MYRNTMGVVKGIGVGMLAGAAAVTVGSRLMKDKKHLKKDMNRAAHTVGEMIDSVGCLLKN